MPAYLNGIGVHLVFERDGQLLLGRRAPSSTYAPDTWHAFAGHLESESAPACAVREAHEELGVRIEKADLELAHVVHQLDAEDSRARMQLFFRVLRWQGEPRICEPDRCTAMGWFSRDQLPKPLVDYTQAALDGIAASRSFTAMGWENRLSRPWVVNG